jgi:hypothetical protein
MRRVCMDAYDCEPDRYVLRPGHTADAPLCPYGNRYKWVGYDTTTDEYVRYSKRLFIKLVKQHLDAQVDRYTQVY